MESVIAETDLEFTKIRLGFFMFKKMFEYFILKS